LRRCAAQRAMRVPPSRGVFDVVLDVMKMRADACRAFESDICAAYQNMDAVICATDFEDIGEMEEREERPFKMQRICRQIIDAAYDAMVSDIGVEPIDTFAVEDLRDEPVYASPSTPCLGNAARHTRWRAQRERLRDRWRYRLAHVMNERTDAQLNDSVAVYER